MLRGTAAAVCLASIATTLTSCSPEAKSLFNEKIISRADFGDEYPFTVEWGKLRCISPSAVIFEVNGRPYTVNGAAQNQGHEKIDAIWRDDPKGTVPGQKINISPVIQAGLKLCNRR